MNDIQTIQPSVNGINDVGQTLKSEAEPPFAAKLTKELDELNTQWENICKQVKRDGCTHVLLHIYYSRIDNL